MSTLRENVVTESEPKGEISRGGNLKTPIL